MINRHTLTVSGVSVRVRSWVDIVTDQNGDDQYVYKAQSKGVTVAHPVSELDAAYTLVQVLQERLPPQP